MLRALDLSHQEDLHYIARPRELRTTQSCPTTSAASRYVGKAIAKGWRTTAARSKPPFALAVPKTLSVTEETPHKISMYANHPHLQNKLNLYSSANKDGRACSVVRGRTSSARMKWTTTLAVRTRRGTFTKISDTFAVRVEIRGITRRRRVQMGVSRQRMTRSRVRSCWRLLVKDTVSLPSLPFHFPHAWCCSTPSANARIFVICA